jgi:hypothetical protein
LHRINRHSVNTRSGGLYVRRLLAGDKPPLYAR